MREVIFSIREGLDNSNGRMMTRELLGLSTIPVRFTSISGKYILCILDPNTCPEPIETEEHYFACRNADREACSRFISASESRNARVDSAP